MEKIDTINYTQNAYFVQ